MRRPEIVHGLRNLVQNAVDFATGTVWVDATWTDHDIKVRIADDGEGYPAACAGTDRRSVHAQPPRSIRKQKAAGL